MAATAKPNANEIPLSIELYIQANDAGVTFSQYLEMIDPSEKYGPEEKLDAFERQMKRFGIISKSMPEKGVWASKVEKFYTTQESRIIFPEFINRVAREELLMDDILNELVAISTPIDSNAYRTIYIKDDPKAASKKRVAEGADLPVAEMKTQENTLKIYKYGRRLKATYEAIRRMRLDLLALHIRAIIRQAGVDRAEDAYNVLISGDGNNNAAIVHKKSELQADPSKALAYGAWADYLFDFYPHRMTTLIGGKKELIEFLTMEAPNVDPIRLIEQLRFGNATTRGTMAQSIFNDYRIVYLPDAQEGKLVGLDKQYGLEMVVEIGSDITETQRIITSQWEEIVISELNGFGILLPKARRVLDLKN